MTQADESHRSIYKKYKAIFDYFDAYLLGLTATPRDEIDKNTYSIFDLESGVPTYAYDLEKAVEDGYLVDYKTYEVKSKIMEEGIRYDQLSEEEKEQYENTFDEDENVGEEIDSSAVNEWLFNYNTIDLVINTLMEKGLKVEGGDKLGKTIIFAKSHKHALAIVERFNKLYPYLRTDFIKVIDYSINYVDTLIDDFFEKNKFPQIAVSVDMLDTGVDIPEILNLVFFKKIRSKSKFWQMIGRGTRLCKDLLGAGIDKKEFLIFDFCNNFEFFRTNPKGFEGNVEESLTEKLFNIKVDMIRELQDLKYSNDEYKAYRQDLLDEVLEGISVLNEDNFRVRMELYYVHKYKNIDEWAALGTLNSGQIKEHISPLIIPLNDDELAKRFDLLIYTIELATLRSNSAVKPIKSVIDTAENLSKFGTIPEIQEQKHIIDMVKTEEFWKNIDIFELDTVRQALRELIKYLPQIVQKIYYTNFQDFIIKEESNAAIYNVNDLKDYRKKVEHYLKENKDEIAIYKLRNNKKLTKKDLKTLEDIMWTKLGTHADYEKEFGDMPINKLVRKIVGLDREAANEAFSEFLNNENLNMKQIHFVKLIVDYVVANGLIDDNRVLQEDPFRTIGSIIELFKYKMDDARKIMNVIAEIKKNSEEVV